MGLLDLNGVFAALDPARKGYLTIEKIQQFHETLHFTSIDKQQCEAAISQICGKTNDFNVTKDGFVAVLQELDRRKNVEEKARWDYMGLDKSGNCKLSIKDTLMLFKMTHGPQFSMQTWKQFLSSRENPYEDTYFDEVRLWLCSLPSGSPCTSQEFSSEEVRLTNWREEETNKNFKEHRKHKETNLNLEAQHDQDYREQVKRMARRKNNRWQKEGLESLLYDDGVDRGEAVPILAKNSIGINDILEALELKYDRLRKKLFNQMLEKDMGAAMWASQGESEQLETLQQIQMHEKQMRNDGTLQENVNQLHGANTEHGIVLQGMLGLIEDVATLKNQLHDKRLQLKQDGKSDLEIDKVMRSDFEKSLKGTTQAGVILIALNDRFQKEKEKLLSTLRTDTNGKGSGRVLVSYCQLMRQLVANDSEEVYSTSLLAVGLAERPQIYPSEKYEPDRSRQELLAEERLDQKKGHKARMSMDDADNVKNMGVVDLQVDMVKQLTWKNILEREALIDMLQGKNAEQAKRIGKSLNEDQRSNRLTQLRKQRTSWRDSASEYRVAQRGSHIQILQEGVGVYFETSRSTLKQAGINALDGSVDISILASLQQKQDQEFEEKIASMQNKKEKDLIDLRNTIRNLRKEEVFDNLAAVILGVYECTELEMPYVHALEEKYDTLRNILFLHMLKAEYGLAWDKVEAEDKQRLVVKKMMEEKKLRQDGKFEEMERLLTKMPNDIVSLRYYLGEGKAEYARRMAALLEKQEKAEIEGRNLQASEFDEADLDTVKTGNILADLAHRFYSEQDTLIGYIRSHDNKRMQELQMVRIHTETYRAKREGLFNIAGFSLGLMERIEAVKRHPADENRCLQLAKLRAEQRKQRIGIGRSYDRELDEYARPAAGNLVAWEDSVLKEMHKKHSEEMEGMLTLLQDPSLEDLREVACTMSQEERQKRLSELNNKGRHYSSASESHDNFLTVLEEAAAIKSTLKREFLEKSLSKEVSNSEVCYHLVAELQNEQDTEIAVLIPKLAEMTLEELNIRREFEIEARHKGEVENAFKVLTRFEGTGANDELVKALEEKYDALRDKLLLEAMMQQMSESDWKKMSEQERQKKLMQMKLLEKKLRREGNFDELQKLFGDSVKNEESLRRLMGDNREDYNKKLQERLARRQRRIDQGLPPDEDEEELIEESEDGKSKNIFENLQQRFEDEKNALLARLKGMNDEVLGERERQAELVRLRREKRQAEREDKFDSAAMLVGLAERQNEILNERFKNDRERQENLAKQRLEELRKRRGQSKKGKENEDVIREGGRTELQDVILKRLDEKHSKERELFVELLSSKDEQLKMIAQASSHIWRKEKLEELKEKRDQIQPEKTAENIAVLKDACIVKIESQRDQLGKDKNKENITEDDIHVALLADLQVIQNNEAEECIQKFPEQNEEDLIQSQIKILYDKKFQRSDNIATCVLENRESKHIGKDELLEALDAKYDTLKDKMIAEALMQQVGDSVWQKMSEQERQRKIVELKLKQKKLQQEGKLDEAAALLGESWKNHEALENLIGESKEEQARKLKERLQKRKQRKEQGMSEEEIETLEKQEIAKEEEENAKKRKNILLDMEHQYDKERDELLKLLADSDGKLASEKARQLQLARLRREQKKCKQEEKFDAAALVLGLAKDHEKAKEADRMRQEKLAKERLQARLKARKRPSDKDIALPEDKNDIIGVQDAFIKEMERKHEAEREIFLELVKDEASGQFRMKGKELNAEKLRACITELTNYRKMLRESPSYLESHPEEQINTFREAIGIQSEIKYRVFAEEGKSNSDEDIQVSLLADLQQVQDEEAHKLMRNIESKDSKTLENLKMVHETAFKQGWNDNIAAVLLDKEHEDLTNLTDAEVEVVEALEDKYDALRDKLLMEALVKQMGERDWTAMTERERQHKLTQLKLQEKKLRQEGKFDDAAALLGEMLANQDELQSKLGQSHADQKRQLEERLKRRKQLMKERESKGLSNDDAILDALQDEEEKAKPVKKKNVLEELQHHLEDEKAALLASLRDQDSRINLERKRQLELVKLRREKKIMAQEEKFDSAALLLHESEQHDKKRKADFATERERQKQLAKERIEARRNKRQTKISEEEFEKQLKEEAENDKLKEALEVAKEQQEGSVALKETLLGEVENKQKNERDMLMDLITGSRQDQEVITFLMQLNQEDVRFTMEKLRQDRSKWRTKSRQIALRITEGNITDEEEKQHIKDIAKYRYEQQELLKKAVALKIQVEKEALKTENPELSDEQLNETLDIALLTDLQQKQMAENSALQKIMEREQDDTMLKKLKDSQRLAVKEGWYDNLTHTVFEFAGTEQDEATAEDEGKEEKLKEELEKEFQKETEEKIEQLKKERPGEDIDLDAEMAKLKEQQAAQMGALQAQLLKQREMNRQKLAAKRLKRENAQYEHDAAFQMLKMADRQQSFVAEKSDLERTRQGDVMQQRLAERREARRQAAEKQDREKGNTLDSKQEHLDVADMPLLRSEKSMLEADISEDQKKETYEQLVREATVFHRKMTMDQQRQQEVLAQRLQERKDRRHTEAAALIGLGQRQKTTLEKSRQDEKDRQVGMMKERVAKVRYERTMTMKDRSKKTKTFEDMMKDEPGGDENEKMEKLAKEMEMKFKQEQGNEKKDDAARRKIPEEGGATEEGATPKKKMDENSRLELLKQRRLAKRKK